jgi:hypothetical protein
MSEAAPQAAGGMSKDEIYDGLRMLEMLWGDGRRMFGFDPKRGWWCAGQIGSIVFAGTPPELGEKLNGNPGHRDE